MKLEPVDGEELGVAGPHPIEGRRVAVEADELLGSSGEKLTAGGIPGIIESVVSGSETSCDQSVAISSVVGHADDFIFVNYTISITAFFAGDSIRP